MGESPLKPEMAAPEVTPDCVTAQGNTAYVMYPARPHAGASSDTDSSRPTRPRRSQYQNRSDPAITVA